MGPGKKGKRFLLNFPGTNNAARTKCPSPALAHFRSSALCVELSQPAWSIARFQENFFPETVPPVRREANRRRSQDRRAGARDVRKAPQDRDAQPAIPAPVRAH